MEISATRLDTIDDCFVSLMAAARVDDRDSEFGTVAANFTETKGPTFDNRRIAMGTGGGSNFNPQAQFSRLRAGALGVKGEHSSQVGMGYC